MMGRPGHARGPAVLSPPGAVLQLEGQFGFGDDALSFSSRLAELPLGAGHVQEELER